MQETPNYQLKKIELTDSPPDITVQNDNWDTIDSKLKAAADHEGDSGVHVTTTDKSNWNSKAAGSHTHSEYFPSTGGTISGDVTIKGSGNYGNKLNFGDGDYVHISEPTDDCMEIKAKKVNFVLSDTSSTQFTINGSNPFSDSSSAFTNFTFTKSHASFGAHWGQIFYVNYLGVAYINIGISVNAAVNAGAIKIGSVNSSYKPPIRTQLAASLSRGHAFISNDGSITLYSEINLSSGLPIYISGWYKVTS